MKDTIWQCADGRLIPVRQMEYSHLLNCIAKIQRDGTWRRKYLDRLLLELTIRDMEGRE